MVSTESGLGHKGEVDGKRGGEGMGKEEKRRLQVTDDSPKRFLNL